MGGISGTPGQVTITPVYWAPAGYTFAASYKTIINGYLANVAADSQATTNVFSVATEYYQQATPGGSPILPIRYLVTAGSEIDDAAPFPAQGGSTGCTADAGFTACVADGALQLELTTRLTALGKPIDDSHLYLLFFPSGVETCSGPGSSTTVSCSTTVYCAYHSGFQAGPSPAYLLYGNEPYPDLRHCSDPRRGTQAPNGDSFADAQISLVSHEASEAITDAFGTWYDSAGYENGDECAYVYGAAINSTGVPTDAFASGTAYNQSIGTGKYWTQDEFSNQAFAAGAGDLNSTTAGGQVVLGCRQRSGIVATTVPGPPNTLNPTPGNGQVALTWSAPASNGGAAITAYRVTPYIGTTAQAPISTGSTAGSYTVTGLSNGTAYSFTVAAVNAAGTGPDSSQSSPVVPAVMESLGGVLSAAPAATSWSSTRTDVFIRGTDNALYHKSWNGSTWSAAENLGGGLGSAPAAVSWGPDRIDVFVRGTDGQLWHKGWYGTYWGPWAPLGGGLAGAPVVASWSAGRLDIFVQGTDGQLWHKGWYGSSWGAWQPLGGGLASAPAAVSWGPNHIDVFVRATDNALWQRAWTGSAWSAWTSRGGGLSSAPSVSSCASQHLDVYALGSGSVLGQLGYNGTSWSAWKVVGNRWTADPAAVCRVGTQIVDLFLRGNDNALWHIMATAS